MEKNVESLVVLSKKFQLLQLMQKVKMMLEFLD